ncbi:PREDICTED: cyclic nucleotide-gated [Prunus dulcis]|uniref:PREDICTED: cyclic nucleotide-gated n=1 Tax=Prunus dulcis TaxID=3755 RepID=A0A5E4FCL1_PRUDU|nr:PREDICTED: cyclic nucleotide-gated [Prunus dulcis]
MFLLPSGSNKLFALSVFSGEQHSIQRRIIQHWRNALVPFSKSAIEDEHSSTNTDKTPDQPKSFLQEWWSTIFVISCVLAVLLDPLFFYIPIVKEDRKCLKLDKRLKAISFALRLLTDLFYIADLMHRILARPKARTTKADEAVPFKRSTSMSTNVLAKAKRILQSYILPDILAVLPVPQGDTGTYADTAQDLTTLDDLLQGLCYPIQKIYSELSCQCSGGGDLDASMMELLRTLKCYRWETKVVLTLAAFAVYNGEFRLMAQLRIKNPSVKYAAILKQLSVKSQLKAIDKIIESIIKVTKCFVEYVEMIQSNCISGDTPFCQKSFLSLCILSFEAHWLVPFISPSSLNAAEMSKKAAATLFEFGNHDACIQFIISKST